VTSPRSTASDLYAAADRGELPSGLTVVDPTSTSKPTAQPSAFALALEVALADIGKALGSSSKAAERDPLFRDAAALLGESFPDASWLVTGLITRGGIVMIGAEPKSVKTWLALEIALAVATGTKVCGEFYAVHGRAAYIFAEDQPRQVRNRLRALEKGAGRQLEAGRLHVQPRGAFLDVTKDQDLAWIVASCRKFGAIDLLVLDPLRDISSAAEDKSDEMSVVMRRLRLLAELLTCTVAVVHHAGKASVDTAKRRPGQRLRGSGAIHGSTDSGIYLGDLDGDGSQTFTNVVDSEIKGARSAGRFTLELGIVDDDQGEAVDARWKVSRDVKATAKVTAKATADQGDDDKVYAFVAALVSRGEHPTRRALRLHDERPVAEKKVTAAVDRMLDSGRLRLVSGAIALAPRFDGLVGGLSD